MKKQIKLEITAQGGIALLHDDEFKIKEFGKVSINRASHVEADENGEWYVQSAKTGEMLRTGFDTRAEALAWEKQYYSPGGEGWHELKQD